MKTRRLLLIILALSFAPQHLHTSDAAGAYSAKLISPTAVQIVYPGQKVWIEWKSALPPVDLAGCHMNVWLSLDGGRTFTMCITPLLDPGAEFFYWTVPNTPTNAAVIDIRFGCEGSYPESRAPQPASTFVISNNPMPLS